MLKIVNFTRVLNYVTGLTLSMIVACILSGAIPSAALAQDRVGSFGQSITFPYDLEPTAKKSSEVYSMDFGYSYSDRWWGTFSWEFGLKQNNRIDLGFGGRYYLILHTLMKPFVYVTFLYSVDPKNDIGWRTGFGADWDFVQLTKQNNLRLEFQTGGSGFIIPNTPNTYSIDVARIGLCWSY